jgi:hypothetical protein
MPQYDVRLSDGRTVRVNAPEGATQEQIGALAFQTSTPRESRVDLLRQDAERRRRIAEEQLAANRRRRAVEETGLLGQLGRGLGAGALNVAELATLGALTPLGEDLEAPARESVSSFFEGLQPELLAGEGEGSTAQRVAGGLGQAFGSFAPIALTGGLAGLPAAAAVGVAAGAGEASERAREFGLNGFEAGRQALKGAFVGATEAIPVARLLRGVDKIADNLPRGWKEQTREALITGGEEAAQEVVAGALQNAIESGYNPEQDILETGLAEEGGYGFAVGATLEGLVQLAAGRRFRQRVRADEAAIETTPGTELIETPPPALEAPSGTQGELFSAEEMGLRAVQPEQEVLQLEDLRPDDRQQDMFARIEDQMADEISAAPFERTEAIEPVPFERTDDVDRDSPMAQAMREAQRRQAFEQIEAEQAAQREAELDRLQNLARAEREVEAAPELRPAEPPMAQEPAPLEEPVQESLPGLGRPYQRGVTEEPAPEPRVVTREELRGIGLAGGSRLVKRIAGKPFESEEVQDEIANFVGNMNVSPEQRAAVRRWANETAAEQQDLFAEPISERARRRQEAEGRRRDRPVEPVVVPEEVTPEPPPAVAPEPVPAEPEPEAVTPEVTPEPEAAAPAVEIIGQPPRTKAMQRFLEKERDRVVAVGVEEDGVRIYTRSDLDPADDGSGTFFGASETAAIKDFYARIQPRQQTEAAPEAQPEPEPASESEQEAPPASERREQAPRELTEEELGAEGPRQTLGLDEIRRVDMDEAFRQAQPPRAADQVDRTEAIGEAVSRASGTRAAENAFIRAKRGFETLRAAVVQGMPYANLTSRFRGPNPLTTGDYNILGDLLSREGSGTKERLSAQRYFSRYPTPADALRALVHEDVFGADRFKKATDRTSKALGQLAEVSGATPEADVAFFSQMGGDYTQAALNWVNSQMSQEVRAWMAQESFRQRAALAKYEQRSSKDLIKEIRANEQRIRKQEEALEEQLAREAKTSDNVLKNSKQAIDLFRKQDPNSEVMQPLSPAVEVAFELDGVSAGLYTLANTLKSKPLRKIAMRLSTALRNSGTQIRVVNMANLLQERPALRNPANPEVADPGMFVLEENTIYLDAATGLDALNFMHEATHAATAYFMRSNPSMPAVRQINKLYETIAPNLDGYYGAESVDEFVAEVYANPDFRSKLARLNLDGTEMTAWQRFVNAIKSMFGFDGSVLGQAQEAVDQIVAGSEMVGDPGTLWIASTKGNGGEVLKNAYRALPEGTEQAAESLKAFVADGTVPRTARKAVRFIQDLNLIKRTAGDKFPMYAGLEDIVRKQAQYAYNLLNYGQETVRALNGWAKDARKESITVDGRTTDKLSLLSDAVNFSTRNEVDLSRPRSAYESALTQAQQRQGRAVPGGAEYMAALDAVNNAQVKLTAYDTAFPWYSALGSDGQAQYKRAFNVFKRYKSELVDILKARLEQVPDATTRARLTRELVDKLEEGGIDPYFPLARDGTYWISYTANDPITGSVEAFTTGFTSPDERRKAIEQLQARGNEIGLQGEIASFRKLQATQFRDAPPESFVGSVQKLLRDANVPEEVQAGVLEMYVNLLPERSFAKGLMHREGKRGDINDLTPLTESLPRHNIVEVIEKKTQQFAKQFSIFKYARELSELEAQADTFVTDRANAGNTEVEDYYDDFKNNRLRFVRNPDISPMSRAVTSSLYMFTMGFSPASAALQFSTVPLVTYPMLGGEFGFVDAGKQIARSTSLLKNAGNKRMVERAGADQDTEVVEETFRFSRSLANYDLDAGKPENMTQEEYDNLKVFIDELGKYNELGHTVNADILDLEGTRTNLWGRMQQWAGFMNHTSELAARQVSGHAYYELALSKISAPTDADRRRIAKDAIEFVSRTNSSNLSGGVAPMSQNDYLRTFAMFKRWPISMLQLQLEVLNEAFAGATPQERKMARWQLAGMYGTAGLLAGATGVPFYGVLQMVFDALREDDEEDFDTLVRTYMGEAFAKGVVNYGLGIDVSTRMAMTNLAFREPLIAQDNLLWDALVMFGGPVIGVPLSVGRAVDLMGQGNVERAFETLLPIQAKNILRTGRFATEGARTLNGDPIVGDISLFHIAGQLLGFAPAEYIRQLEQNAALAGIDRAIVEEKRKLLQKLNIARRDGSPADDVMEDIADFNSRHPQTAIDGDTIRRSQQAYARTAERRRAGVVFSDQNREKLERMAEAWGDPTFWD